MNKNLIFTGYQVNFPVFKGYVDWILGCGDRNSAAKSLLSACKKHGSYFVYDQLIANLGVSTWPRVVDASTYTETMDLYRNEEERKKGGEDKIRIKFILM